MTRTPTLMAAASAHRARILNVGLLSGGYGTETNSTGNR